MTLRLYQNMDPALKNAQNEILKQRLLLLRDEKDQIKQRRLKKI